MPSADQVQAAVGGQATHPREPHTGGIAERLNRLRAAVLGANDGIVSVAGIVIASPEAELTELTALYEAKGLSAATARTVAAELTSHGALAAHLDAELHIDPADIPSPVQASAASALSFTAGAVLPLLAILLPPATARVPVTFAAVLIALGLAGALSAHLGGSNIRRAVLRLVIGGALGLAFTYGIGHLFGTAIG